MKLSILIPAYNVETYLPECLHSLAPQMTDACEIIVYDDCSGDATAARVAELQQGFPGTLRLETGTTNRGVSAARNRLLDLARGEYVWFIDSDDKAFPNAITTIMQALTGGVDAVAFGFHIWPEGGAPAGPLHLSFTGPEGVISTSPGGFYAMTLASGNTHPWSRVLRRALFSSDLRFPEGRIYEDLEIIPLVMSRARSAAFIKAPLIAYRQRTGSLLNISDAAQEVDTLTALGQQRARYEDMHGAMSPEAASAFVASCAGHLRGVVKRILKTVPQDQQKALLGRALHAYDAAVQMNDRRVFATLYQNAGLFGGFQLWKRIRQARRAARQRPRGATP